MAVEVEGMFHVEQYGVIIIGGGHAGCEAALASARIGVSTLLVTLDPSKLGFMPCNPSIGGVGKGQLVKEIDALGGEMGRVADETGIHFRRLNTRKGSAVQSSRCQSDKHRYSALMAARVVGNPKIEVLEKEVSDVWVDQGRVVGVILGDGSRVKASRVVITAGTFLRAIMHCGDEVSDGGRYGEKSSQGISPGLMGLGLRTIRLKTGTPPRLSAKTLDFGQMWTQEPESPIRGFSFVPTPSPLPQVSCHLGFTNEQVHGVIQRNLDKSPLYSGKIQGIGPRYCPSIEDKVVKFPDKPRHQVFFEPEALGSDWIYPNGISTSLPPEVQEAFVRGIPGCEEAQFLRYGYAVEYDCFDPRDLRPTLESKLLPGLYFAGQVNGTSGYEEAAAQGLIAGANAALAFLERPALILDRSQAYIGVMIDDLTRTGVNEPYRMFTSRAEYRLSLREDNADLRLTPLAREAGLIPEQRWRFFEERTALLVQYRTLLEKSWIKAEDSVQEALSGYETAPLPYNQTAKQLLKRPELGLSQVLGLLEADLPPLSPQSMETLEVETKYEGYIQIQKEEIERHKKLSGTPIPRDFDYGAVVGLSYELREKLGAARPSSVGDLSRIPGVTPAAISALLFKLKRREARA